MVQPETTEAQSGAFLHLQYEGKSLRRKGALMHSLTTAVTYLLKVERCAPLAFSCCAAACFSQVLQMPRLGYLRFGHGVQGNGVSTSRLRLIDSRVVTSISDRSNSTPIFMTSAMKRAIPIIAWAIWCSSLDLDTQVLPSSRASLRSSSGTDACCINTANAQYIKQYRSAALQCCPLWRLRTCNSSDSLIFCHTRVTGSHSPKSKAIGIASLIPIPVFSDPSASRTTVAAIGQPVASNPQAVLLLQNLS